MPLALTARAFATVTYEKGTNAVSSARLLELAGSLRVTVGWLVGEGDTAENEMLIGSRRLELLLFAAFTKIEDQALRVIALRAVQAFATASQVRRADGRSIAAFDDGADEVPSMHTGNGVGVACHEMTA